MGAVCCQAEGVGVSGDHSLHLLTVWAEDCDAVLVVLAFPTTGTLQRQGNNYINHQPVSQNPLTSRVNLQLQQLLVGSSFMTTADEATLSVKGQTLSPYQSLEHYKSALMRSVLLCGSHQCQAKVPLDRLLTHMRQTKSL